MSQAPWAERGLCHHWLQGPGQGSVSSVSLLVKWAVGVAALQGCYAGPAPAALLESSFPCSLPFFPSRGHNSPTIPHPLERGARTRAVHGDAGLAQVRGTSAMSVCFPINFVALVSVALLLGGLGSKALEILKRPAVQMLPRRPACETEMSMPASRRPVRGQDSASPRFGPASVTEWTRGRYVVDVSRIMCSRDTEQIHHRHIVDM